MSLIFLSLIIGGCGSLESGKEIIIIPKNFNGVIVIFYDQKEEKGKVTRSSSEINLYVPNDGLIKTKYKSADFNSVELRFIDLGTKSKVLGGHSGSIFLPHEVQYAVYYIGKGIGFDKLTFDELRQTYLSGKIPREFGEVRVTE